jgi:uncharacterized protein (TIGR03545 family)
MKTVLSWIRWKYVGPLLIVVAALLVFFILFFDPLLARGIELVGGKINGAEVDVSGLKTKFVAGRISIARLQVTDKDAPLQNVVEAGPLAFQLSLSDLFSKRAIINDAELKGLAFGTTRKKSGAFPLKAAKRVDKDQSPSAASKLVDKYKDRFKLNIDGIKGDVQKRIEFDPKDLELVKSADALKAKSANLPKQWKTRVDTLDVDGRLKKAEADLAALRNTPTKGTEALTAIPAAIKKLGQVKSDLDQLKQDVAVAKASSTAEVTSLKSGIAGLTQAKQRDVNNLMSRLNLDFVNPDRLVEGLIGPLVVQRVKTAMYYVELVRKNMPSKKDQTILPPKPRATGMDITFPTPAAPPTFWLMKAALEGAYHGVAASGSLTNATSDPSKIGLPCKLSMSGQQNAQHFSLEGLFDHTKDVSADSLSLHASGLNVASLLSTGGPSPDFSQGQARIDLGMALRGESALSGKLEMGLSGLKFAPGVLFKKVGLDPSATLSADDKLKADFINNVGKAIEGMKEFAVVADITGTWQDPDLKLSSNLGSALSNVIKNSVGTAVGEQRKELESRVNAILVEKTHDLDKQASALESGSNGQFADIQAKIQAKINEATGLQIGPSGGSTGLKIPSLNKFFKK